MCILFYLYTKKLAKKENKKIRVKGKSFQLKGIF